MPVEKRDEFRDSEAKDEFRWGDTLVEVLFAVTIFGVVALLSITAMNRGVSIAESTLEESMARMEIDAQAEAIRFIQNSYANDHELKTPDYKDLWEAIKKVAKNNSGAQSLDVAKCSDKYVAGDANGILDGKTFIVNTRKIDINSPETTIIASSADKFKMATLHPRVLYGTSNTNNSEAAAMGADSSSYTAVLRAEGIWVYPVKASTNAATDPNTNPQFYDFHISTCWYSPSGDRPTTIGTILRLYNPEYVERR